MWRQEEGHKELMDLCMSSGIPMLDRGVGVDGLRYLFLNLPMTFHICEGDRGEGS